MQILWSLRDNADRSTAMCRFCSREKGFLSLLDGFGLEGLCTRVVLEEVDVSVIVIMNYATQIFFENLWVDFRVHILRIGWSRSD